MASLSTSGLDDLINDFDSIAEIPDSVILEMLTAEADILADAQKTEALSMLNGGLSKGITAEKITISTKLIKGKGGRYIKIYPKGTRTDGNSRPANEVAFVNEYGAKGKPARPFIKVANEKAAPAAVEAAAEVFDRFLKSKNL